MSSIYIDKKLIFNIIKKEFYSSQPKDYDSEESLLGNSEDCSEVAKGKVSVCMIWGRGYMRSITHLSRRPLLFVGDRYLS